MRARLVSCGGFVLLAAALAIACGASAPGSEPSAHGAAPARPRFVGRFDGPRYAWSGSRIEARFRGRGVAVRLQTAAPSETTYGVTLDGRELPAIAVTARETRYVLATDLDPSVAHEVAVTRDAEAFAGVHRFLGLDVEGGELLPPRDRLRRIEIVGDSITCGYGILGESAACRFSFATERASLAFGAIVGRALDADVTTICFSGRGVLRNYDGTTQGTMPELFELTLPEEPRVPFDFRLAPAPDAVVTALGTNDVLGGEAPLDFAAFEVAYVRFLRRIRAVYAGAWVMVAESPMIPPETRQAFRQSLLRIVDARRGEGDARIELLALPHQGSLRGCDHHPNLAMHQVLARDVASALRSRLGL